MSLCILEQSRRLWCFIDFQDEEGASLLLSGKETKIGLMVNDFTS